METSKSTHILHHLHKDFNILLNVIAAIMLVSHEINKFKSSVLLQLLPPLYTIRYPLLTWRVPHPSHNAKDIMLNTMSSIVVYWFISYSHIKTNRDTAARVQV